MKSLIVKRRASSNMVDYLTRNASQRNLCPTLREKSHDEAQNIRDELRERLSALYQ